MGMKVFALPFLSSPVLLTSHPQKQFPARHLCKSFESSSSPLAIINTERRVEAEDRLSAGEESREAPGFLLEMDFVSS